MRFAILYISLLFSMLSSGQDMRLESNLDTSQIRIGEQAILSLKLWDLKGNEDIVWPDVKDTLSRYVEVIDPGYPDSMGMKGGMNMEMLITITSWDSGAYVIRPLKVLVNEKPLFSEPYLLTVHTVEVDTTSAPMDIKPILEEPFSLSDWMKLNWPYLVAILALLVLIWLIIKLLRNRKKSPRPIVSTPREDPLEVILRKLKRLKDDKAWSREDSKSYYVDLTDLLRDFLELRYSIRAHELTSAEILGTIRAKGLSPLDQEMIQGLLNTSDMVKFAKESPSEGIASSHLDDVMNFVQINGSRKDTAESENE